MAIEESRTSNALGVPLPQWIINQLDRRSAELSVKNKKTNIEITENILFRGNRTAWTRLVSSINLIDPYIVQLDPSTFELTYIQLAINKAKQYFQDRGINITSENDLAKLFVLQGGVSKYSSTNNSFSYTLRNGFSESYNLTGTNSEIQNYGYRPMPGITSVRVQTQGKLGSIRSAEVQLKVWDKDQLDIIDALYFKLGYTMLLEWGHTYYYKAESQELESSEEYNIDPFKPGLTKEDILNQISNNVRNSEGNYDAMLGIVTNFNFTYNQEGGYDCTLKLISLGALISNMKMNNPRILPELQDQVVKRLVNRLIEIDKQKQKEEQLRAQAESTNPSNPNAYPECVRNPEVRGIDRKKSPTAYFDYGMLKIVNGVEYFFYVDGRYQTSALNKNGRYECRNGVLYIDGKNTEETKYTYQEVITNATADNKIAESFKDSFLQGYNLIRGLGNVDYITFDRVKNLLPLDPNKEIVGTINVNNLRDVPSFSGNGFQFYDLILNAYDRSIRNQKIVIPDSARDLGTGIGLDYFEIYSPNGGVLDPGIIDDDYNVYVRYDGLDKTIYEANLFYRYEASTTGKATDEDEATSQQYVQDAIKLAVIDPNTQWKITTSRGTTSKTIVAEHTLQLKNSAKREVVKGKDRSGNDVKQIEDYTYDVAVTLKLTFNDLRLIDNFSVKDKTNVVSPTDSIQLKKEQDAQNVQDIPVDTPPEPPLREEDIQKSESEKYKSAFEVMIRTLQLYSLDNSFSQGIEDDGVIKTLYLTDPKIYEEFSKPLFSVGLFSNTLKDIIDLSKRGVQDEEVIRMCKEYDNEVSKNSILNQDTLLKIRALFGFHFGLLGNVSTSKALLEANLINDYSYTLSTYTVPYKFNSGIFEGTQLNHPVYIPLGLVVMILNHICGIYDDRKPLVYFDFNNRSNLCLTNSKHLSTNPFETLIPFQGSNEDFVSLIEPTTLAVAKNPKTKEKLIVIKPLSGSNEYTPVYTPRNTDTSKTAVVDRISGGLLPFKVGGSDQDTYRGRTMNILVSCDYLLKCVSTFSKSNGSGDVYIREFLEQILFDINKSLGDINIFRLAYDDRGNAAHVVDDQMVPNIEDKYPNPFDEPKNKSKLPIFGVGSIARNVEIRTEVSSKLSNMIAISANSNIEDQSGLSKSADSFGFYNAAYKDRYIPKRTEFTTDVTLPTDTMIRSSQQFNEAIYSFYGSESPADTAVGHATNYYIQRMSKIKSSEVATRASAMIPVSLNFSIDGMSGFGMGQSYTVSEEFLPYTYNLKLTDPFGNSDQVRTVAFITVGLDHTIENNQWISNVRSNMIYAKNKEDFKGNYIKKENLEKPSRLVTSTSTSTRKSTNFVANNDEAKKSAEQFLGRSMDNLEWSELVSATFAEASSDQTERAYVMGVILNRVKSKTWGNTVGEVLRAKNQFQAVTGTSKNPGPSINFVNGPTSQAASNIYGAAVNLLKNVPRNYLYFTSAIAAAYVEGTNIKFIDKLKERGAEKIGNTWFSA